MLYVGGIRQVRVAACIDDKGESIRTSAMTRGNEMEYQWHEQDLLAMPACAIASTVLLTSSPPVYSPVARAFFFRWFFIMFSPRSQYASFHGPVLRCYPCISYNCDFQVAWRPRERSICPHPVVCRKLAIACYEHVAIRYLSITVNLTHLEGSAVVN